MTYRKIFDEVVGEPPVSTVDVDRVISRQRRARRLRIGAAGTGVAAAVLAVVVGTTALVGTPRAADPATPAATVSPTPAVTTVAGTGEDLARIDAAIASAARRELPDLRWTDGTVPPPGRVVPEPVWFQTGPPPDTARSYGRYTNYRLGGRDGQLSLMLRRDAHDLWRSRPPCPTRGLAAAHCTVTTGPNGEQIRAQRMVNNFGKATAPQRPTPGHVYHVEVLRPDRTLVTVTASGTEDLVTTERLTAMALDPAITLAPPTESSPAPTFDAATVHMDWQTTRLKAETALGAALDEVWPDGVIFASSPSGGIGPLGPRYEMVFAVRHGELRGEGEVMVSRHDRALTCDTVRRIDPARHVHHQHAGDCSASTTDDGKRIVTVRTRGAGALTYTVFAQRPDHTFVEVIIDNRPNTGARDDRPQGGGVGDVWPKGTRGGPTPPLTVPQLTALATHPDLLNLLP